MYFLFNEPITMLSVNYFLFNNINKNEFDQTINKIKKPIQNNLNHKVLTSINSYNSNYKYVISGNIHNIISNVVNDFNMIAYGTILDLDKITNKYTGKTNFICLGKNKTIILDKILFDLKKIGKTREKINLIVYGDSYNDYYILKKANIRYIVGSDKTLIDALKKDNLEYLQII
jgi:phosphoserine phosphatase